MSAPDDRNGVEAAKGTREVAREARSQLTKLHHAVVVAEEEVVLTSAAELREANEHLVVSSLRAQGAADEAARAAEQDPLTKLPNRTLLRDRFEQAIVHAKRDQTLMALMFLDLDNFKQINDTLGHGAGDQALRQAARGITSAIRAGDTVSRHGGDEFLILLNGVSQASDAAIVAEKVLAALGVPGLCGDEVPRLTASIGISIYPVDGDDVDTLIERADGAMYAAKKRGPGRFAFHGEKPSVVPAQSFIAPVRRKGGGQ